jgi:hypothetical protein
MPDPYDAAAQELNLVRTESLTGTAKSHDPLAPWELLGGVSCWIEAGVWRDGAKVAMEGAARWLGATDDVPETTKRLRIASRECETVDVG